MIARRVGMRIALFAVALLVGMSLFALARERSRSQSLTANSTIRLYGALWETGDGYSTTVRVKNRDAQNALNATVTLFSKTGVPEQTAQFVVPAQSTRGWELGASTDSLQQGGMEVDLTGPVAKISAQELVEGAQSGISFTLPLETDDPSDTDNALYAPWWLPDAGTDGEITLFNSGAQAIVVSPSVAVDGAEHSLGSMVLNPHENKEVSLRELLGRAEIEDASMGSLTLRYSGPTHVLEPALVLANADTGFVLLPGFNGRHAQQAAGKTTWAFPSIQLLDDTQLQSGESAPLEAYALVTNGTKASVTPELMAYFAGAARSRGQQALIPVGPLGPSETRLIDLGQWVESAGVTRFALEASHAGASGDMNISVFSMRSTQDLVVPSAGAVLPAGIMDSSYWQKADSQPGAVQNAGMASAQAQVTLYYQTSYGVESYAPPSMNVPERKIETLGLEAAVQSGFADSNGNRVPMGTDFGLATLSIVGGVEQATTAASKVRSAKDLASVPLREFAENMPSRNLVLAHGGGCGAYELTSISSSPAGKNQASAAGGTTSGVTFVAEPDCSGGGGPSPPTISGSGNTVWYFSGQSPSGYAMSVTLTSSGGSSTQWAVTAGSTLVRLSSTTGTSITVTSSGTAFSSSVDDVSITASISEDEQELTSDPFYMTTRKPYRLVANGGVTTDCSSQYGYLSTVPYTIQDQLLDAIPSSTGVNEAWTTGVVNDYSGTNWTRQSPGGSSTSVANFVDEIGGSGSGGVPTPSCTGASTKVDHWGQEWRVGSETSGSGTAVQTDTLQKYINHGDHESITSPPQ